METYSAYSFIISSELPLSELSKAGGQADITIRVEDLESAPPMEMGATPFGAAPERPHLYTERQVLLRCDGVGSFLVRDGREILVHPASSVSNRLLDMYLLGPAFAVLLHQRGLLVLHASAIATGGRAAVFLGGAGWGKSTIAALLLARGHRLVSDDVLAVRLDDIGPVVLPAFAQLKLWAKSVAALGEDPLQLSRLHPQRDKLARPAPDAFSSQPVPLRRVYVLMRGDAPRIEMLQPRAALVELIRHTFCFPLLPLDGAKAHFQQCAALVQALPARRLTRADGLDRLHELAKLIEDDLGDDPS